MGQQQASGYNTLKHLDCTIWFAFAKLNLLVFSLCPHVRTETVVEKLLTNWMSICLYAFLRVSSSDSGLIPCWGWVLQTQAWCLPEDEFFRLRPDAFLRVSSSDSGLYAFLRVSSSDSGLMPSWGWVIQTQAWCLPEGEFFRLRPDAFLRMSS